MILFFVFFQFFQTMFSLLLITVLLTGCGPHAEERNPRAIGSKTVVKTKVEKKIEEKEIDWDINEEGVSNFFLHAFEKLALDPETDFTKVASASYAELSEFQKTGLQRNAERAEADPRYLGERYLGTMEGDDEKDEYRIYGGFWIVREKTQFRVISMNFALAYDFTRYKGQAGVTLFLAENPLGIAVDDAWVNEYVTYKDLELEYETGMASVEAWARENIIYLTLGVRVSQLLVKDGDLHWGRSNVVCAANDKHDLYREN